MNQASRQLKAAGIKHAVKRTDVTKAAEFKRVVDEVVRG